MSESTQREMLNLVTEIRKSLAIVEGDVEGIKSEQEEKLEKMFPRLEKLDDNLQKIVAENKAKDEQIKKMEEAMIEFEKKAYRASEKSAGSREIDELAELHKKGYDEYLHHGNSIGDEYNKFLNQQKFSKLFSPEQISKYLRTDVNPDGGYLCPPEYVREIIKPATEMSDIRRIARVRQATGLVLLQPSRISLVTAAWEGEGEEDIKDNSTYGMEHLNLRRLSVTVPITREELMDSAFDMVSEINSDAREKFQEVQGAAFVNGNGVNKPEGFKVNPDVEALTTAASGVVDFNDILDMMGLLKDKYDPNSTFVFNRTTWRYLLKIQYAAGTAAYIWNAGNIADKEPSTLYGRPYLIAPDMDNIAANNYPIVYGDFKKGYVIADREALSIVRDDVTKKRENKIEFTFHLRVGGAVVLAEALKKLKVKS